MISVGQVPVPPAPRYTRIIVPNQIHTVDMRRGQVIWAIYEDERDYHSPFGGNIYTRMKPSGVGASGKWNKCWTGTNYLQCPGHTETEALTELLATLDQHGLPYERETAHAVLSGLAYATAKTAWELRPMGARPHKPRRPRHRWLDPNTGKRINLYKDTLRPHRDPECKCERCLAAPPILKRTTPK